MVLKYYGLLLGKKGCHVSNSGIILGLIYHPDNLVTDHSRMRNHTAQSVEHIRHHHPFAEVIITGDFNQLPNPIAGKTNSYQTIKRTSNNG